MTVVIQTTEAHFEWANVETCGLRDDQWLGALNLAVMGFIRLLFIIEQKYSVQ